MSNVCRKIELVNIGFAEALDDKLKGERMKNYYCVIIHSLHPEPSQPIFLLPMIFNPEEKRGKKFCLLFVT